MEWGIQMSFRVLMNLVAGLAACFIARPSLASPPVDLSDYDGSHRVVRQAEKPLTDKDLIFTDNIIKPEKLLHGLVLFKSDAIGRTEAKPDAKAVLRFRAEYRGRFLQYSKDKKWVAVELLNGRKRAWVPLASVEILDETYTKEAPPPTE
jgi:hypothetical protein